MILSVALQMAELTVKLSVKCQICIATFLDLSVVFSLVVVDMYSKTSLTGNAKF